MVKSLQQAADEVWRIFGRMPSVIGMGLGGRGDTPVIVLCFDSDKYLHLVPGDFFGWPIDKEVVHGPATSTDEADRDDDPTPAAGDLPMRTSVVL